MFSANIKIQDFKKLLHRFPHYSEVIDKISKKNGNVISINISDLNKEKKNLPEDIFNEIYFKALSINENHFSSIQLQFKTIVELPRSKVNHILEIGKGHGVLSSLLKNFDYKYKSFDIDENLLPDICGDVTNMENIESNSFDLICAFQTLEHLHYEKYLLAIKHMARVTNNYLLISLPCDQNYFNLSFKLNFKEKILHRLNFNFKKLINMPNLMSRDIDVSVFDKRNDKKNPHYWEVNRPSYSKKKIIKSLENVGLEKIKDFHNNHYAYHWFILCKKK